MTSEERVERAIDLVGKFVASINMPAKLRDALGAASKEEAADLARGSAEALAILALTAMCSVRDVQITEELMRRAGPILIADLDRIIDEEKAIRNERRGRN